jgi:hypothetical protein
MGEEGELTNYLIARIQRILYGILIWTRCLVHFIARNSLFTVVRIIVLFFFLPLNLPTAFVGGPILINIFFKLIDLIIRHN